MIEWFSKFKRRTEPKVVFLWSGMTLFDWRSSPHYLGFARNLWATQEWKEGLSAIKNAAPSGFPIRGKAITEAEGLIELGRKEGYQDCLNALFSLCVKAPVAPVEIEADYDPKDYSKE